jgi:hypothetical protein
MAKYETRRNDFARESSNPTLWLLGVWFASVRPCLVPKNFQDSPSHRMLGHMYGALNIDEKNLITQFNRKTTRRIF